VFSEAFVLCSGFAGSRRQRAKTKLPEGGMEECRPTGVVYEVYRPLRLAKKMFRFHISFRPLCDR